MSYFEATSDDAKMDFAKDRSCGDYLGLGPILNAQHPLSDDHEEMLFITQHQTSELWMRLAIHELEAGQMAMLGGELSTAFRMPARVSRIFEQLNNAWDVLRTMTLSGYMVFRPSLGNPSGFQSHQYRLVEFLSGNRNEAPMKLHKCNAASVARLEGELAQPSLYQVAISWLCTRFEHAPLDGEPGRSDWQADTQAQDLRLRVYGEPNAHWELYELAEKPVDLEGYFRRWRFDHVTKVERIIGFKRGTGGTAGVSYLRKMLDVELFPELCNVRGAL